MFISITAAYTADLEIGYNMYYKTNAIMAKEYMLLLLVLCKYVIGFVVRLELAAVMRICIRNYMYRRECLFFMCFDFIRKAGRCIKRIR